MLLLKVDGLSVSYGNGMPAIIRDMSFELDSGNILNILGQNAVGKTTLIRALMREIQGNNGIIEIEGKKIDSYSIKEYAKMIGVVSTTYSTYQNLIVADYLITGLINKMTPFSKPNNNCIQKAYDVLNSFGKINLFNKKIDQLSSGERQIVMIARVLLQDPQIIIFDEPTANLDVKNQIAVLNQIKRLSCQGYTVIVTTHNPGHAYSLGGKTLIMGKDEYCFGDTVDVVTAANLSKYYQLDVRKYSVDDYQCLVFQNSKGNNDVKVVF